jgi:hypothetical protein
MSKKPGEEVEPVESLSQEKDFVPGEESNEDFERVLALLAGWVKAGIVNVDVSPDGRVKFDLPVEMRDLFGGELPKRLTEQQVLEIIQVEIPLVTAAGFAKRPLDFFRYRVPENLRGRLADFVKRSEKAIACLVTHELRDRILLRRTTLSYVMKEIRALSGSYESRSTTGEDSNLPFTTVEFVFVRPRGGATMVLMDPGEGFVSLGPKDEIQVRVDFHVEDMKALVKELTEIIEKRSE